MCSIDLFLFRSRTQSRTHTCFICFLSDFFSWFHLIILTKRFQNRLHRHWIVHIEPRSVQKLRVQQHAMHLRVHPISLPNFVCVSSKVVLQMNQDNPCLPHVFTRFRSNLWIFHLKVHPTQQFAYRRQHDLTSALVRTPADIVSHNSQDILGQHMDRKMLMYSELQCSSRSVFLHSSKCSSLDDPDPLLLTRMLLIFFVWVLYDVAASCVRMLNRHLLIIFSRVPQAHPLHFTQLELFSSLGLAFSHRLCPLCFHPGFSCQSSLENSSDSFSEFILTWFCRFFIEKKQRVSRTTSRVSVSFNIHRPDVEFSSLNFQRFLDQRSWLIFNCQFWFRGHRFPSVTKICRFQLVPRTIQLLEMYEILLLRSWWQTTASWSVRFADDASSGSPICGIDTFSATNSRFFQESHCEMRNPAEYRTVICDSQPPQRMSESSILQKYFRTWFILVFQCCICITQENAIKRNPWSFCSISSFLQRFKLKIFPCTTIFDTSSTPILVTRMSTVFRFPFFSTRRILREHFEFKNSHL